jgi:hypothetical protein
MPQTGCGLMGPQFDAAIRGKPEFAVGAIDDGEGIDIKVEQIVGSGQGCFQQGKNLPQQRRGSLTPDLVRPDRCERFSAYPLIWHGPPNATVVMPEPAIRTEHQVLTTGEMLIEHLGDNEFGGIALVLGRRRRKLWQLFL